MTAICRKMDKNNDKPSKFRARKWVEESDNVHGTYKTGKQIKFNTTKVKSL